MQTSEQILGRYILAGSFHTAIVIADLTGRLTDLQRAVARDYAKREWVRRRCKNARNEVLAGYALREADPFPDQVTAWLFPTGATTHVLPVAGLKNPTVRTRYLPVRDLLAEYGRMDVYETLLELLGCSDMSRERAMGHLAALTEAFEAAKRVIRTPFFFAADIGDSGRPVAIDGSRELITRGDHREAAFWMVATDSRCQMVFHQDAPELCDRFDLGYRELLGDIGITSYTDLRLGHEAVKPSLPAVWDIAEAIMVANPGIDA